MSDPTDQPSREGERVVWVAECAEYPGRFHVLEPDDGDAGWCECDGHHTLSPEQFVPASTLQAAEDRTKRAESLVARYSRPFPDGGRNPAERRTATQQRMVKAELRAEAAEAREDALREASERLVKRPCLECEASHIARTALDENDRDRRLCVDAQADSPLLSTQEGTE